MKASRLRSLAVVALLLGAAFLAGRFTATAPRKEEASLASPNAGLSVVPGSRPQNATLPSTPEETEGTVAGSESGLTFTEETLSKISALLSGQSLDHGALTETLEVWVQRDPLTAIDFLAQGPHKEHLLRWIVKIWGGHDPEEASRWLASMPGTEHFDHAVEGLTQAVHHEDPESAFKWAEIIEDPEIKTRVYASSGYQQFRHDHQLAQAALADSGIPPSGQDAILASWTANWDRTAKRNSQNISSVVSAATAAGFTFDMSSEEAVVNQIRKGIFIEDETSAFHGEFFGVPGITELEAEAAMRHLHLNQTVLSYSPEAE